MPTEIYLVKVGMTMSEGTVAEWYVSDGAAVTQGELLYRLETEKVELDVDAASSGTVRHLVPEGATLEPGAVIGWVFAAGEEIPDPLPQPRAQPAASAPAIDPAAPASTSADRPVEAERIRASPAARRLAKELGVDLGRVRGSGPGGRIIREDVEAATPPGGARREVAVEPRPGEAIPLRGMRRTIARRMHESLQTTAQLTMDMEVRMDDAVRLREQLIQEWESEGVRPTYTDLVVRAVAKALRKHPILNSELREREIVLLEDVHIGVAVALDEGLVVPVIRSADALGLKEIAAEAARLAREARAGKLGLDDMHGGTFTVSALGMYGVDSFTPILNPPQVGILGVNRIYEGLAWRTERPVPSKCMRLSLTWDHRVLDGAPAAQFLASVRELLEAPYRLLI